MDLQEAFDRGFEAVKSYIDAELAILKSREPIPGPPGAQGPPGPAGEVSMLVPLELARQVAGVARLLHEAPPIVQRSEVARPPPRVVRIDRDEEGSFVPVYDEPRP